MLIASAVAFLAAQPRRAWSAVGLLRSRGREYTPLSHIRSIYSMTLTESRETIDLRNRWHTLGFEPDGRRSRVNGTLVWLSHPLRKIGWHWALEDPDFGKTVDPSLRPAAYLRRVRTRTVVLDPGHGGNDLGAVSPRNVQEKRVALDVSRRVRMHLQERGVRVEMTRDSDEYVSIDDRCRRAAALRGDMLVSIHANSAGTNRSARGSETFVLSLPGCYSTNSYGRGTPSSTRHSGNQHDEANAALGYRLQQHLLNSAGLPDRGVRRARFGILRDAPCPAALVETLFLSNPVEEAFVIEASGRERLARGIAGGVLAYINDAAR